MKLSNEYINKQYLINMLACVHPEDRNWEEAISVIESCGAMETYPINWIDTNFLNYDINDIYKRPYVVALPIKVGNEVYVDPSSNRMLKDDGCLRKGEVVNISLNKSVIIFTVRFSEEETSKNRPITIQFSLDEIEKTVFLKERRDYERR